MRARALLPVLLAAFAVAPRRAHADDTPYQLPVVSIRVSADARASIDPTTGLIVPAGYSDAARARHAGVRTRRLARIECSPAIDPATGLYSLRDDCFFTRRLARTQMDPVTGLITPRFRPAARRARLGVCGVRGMRVDPETGLMAPCDVHRTVVRGRPMPL